MPVYLGEPVQDDPGAIGDYEATFGQAVGAALRRSYDETQFVGAAYRGLMSQADWDAGNRITQADALARVGKEGMSLDIPEGGISKYKLDTLIYLKRRELEDQSAMSRRSGVLTSVSQFGAGVLGTFGDPVSVAANFIPVVGQAKYANALSRATTVFGRAAVRAKMGAVEGAVGASLIEPLSIAANNWSQTDYTAMDSFMNVTFGTAAGAALHSIGGFGYDKFKSWTASRVREYAPYLSDDMQQYMFWRQVDAAERGQRLPDPEYLIREELQRKGAMTDEAIMERGLGHSDEEISTAQADIEFARAPDLKLEKGLNLLSRIALDGGIRVRDANGDLTPEGTVVLQILNGSKVRGVINNVHGAPPERLHETLAEDGWFIGGKNEGNLDINDLYELLDTAARSGDVRHPEFADNVAREKYENKLRAQLQRELEEAGVKPYEPMLRQAAALAGHRANKIRERARPPGDVLKDTRGGGKQFHGTSEPITSLADHFGSTDSIYGTGLYTSDAADAAFGYTKKGRGRTPTVYEVSAAGDVKLLDMEQPVPGWVPESFRGDGEMDELAQDALDAGPATLREFYDVVRALSSDHGMSKADVQDLFDEIARIASERGYRGLRHIGGGNTGTAPHEVKIFWTPEKDVKLSEVVPEVAERGGDTDFDPEEFLHPEPRALTPDEETARFTDEGEPYTYDTRADSDEHQRTVEEEAEEFRAQDEEATVTEDIAALDGMILSMRAQGKWTAADEAIIEALKQNDADANEMLALLKQAAACELQ